MMSEPDAAEDGDIVAPEGSTDARQAIKMAKKEMVRERSGRPRTAKRD